jgi:ABC-type nitrate/sulfonate/bicarbonate transport system substrate-binding protein
MKTLRIIGVPEHFNYPFRLLKSEQPFIDKGVTIEWIEESRGSGQMSKALRADETDLALLLTESFLKEFEEGNPSKMVGLHVATPLVWGAHVRASSSVSHIEEIDESRFLVSRMGSGSHLMALVLAGREGWDAGSMSFHIVGNMDGAKTAMDAGDDGIFLWEKYTTAPMVKNGTMKLIGEVPSPWPCFVLVATEKALKEYGELIYELRDRVYQISERLMQDAGTIDALTLSYELDKNDITRWLSQTKWCTKAIVSRAELERAMDKMRELGILKSRLALDRFLASGALRIDD